MIQVLLLILMVLSGCQTSAPGKNVQDLPAVLHEVKKSFNMQDTKVKYCPVCGKHYSGHLEECPVDHAKLVPIE